LSAGAMLFMGFWPHTNEYIDKKIMFKIATQNVIAIDSLMNESTCSLVMLNSIFIARHLSMFRV
jgi:hypothetical protein